MLSKCITAAALAGDPSCGAMPATTPTEAAWFSLRLFMLNG